MGVAQAVGDGVPRLPPESARVDLERRLGPAARDRL